MHYTLKAIDWDGKTTNVSVTNGKISALKPLSVAQLPKWTALGPLRDMHCHLDKSFFGEPWRPRKPVQSVWENIQQELAILHDTHLSISEHAFRHLSLLRESGTRWVRSHIDIGPKHGLSHLDGVLQAVQRMSESVMVELVAFPQQGLVRSRSKTLMRQALQLGATVVGGLDPMTIDTSLDKSLEETFDLSVETNSPIDIHVHEPNQNGLETLCRIADFTRESGKMGHVSVSHAYALGTATGRDLISTLEQLAAAQIRIITAMPLFQSPLPIEKMREMLIPIGLGTDNVYDAWSPFGSGDMLEKASRLAEILGWKDDDRLTLALQLASYPLPAPGESADFVLVPASCRSEAVARYPFPRLPIRNGTPNWMDSAQLDLAWLNLSGPHN